MRVTTLGLAGVSALILAGAAGTAGTVRAQAPGAKAWIHVRVEEGHRQSKVSVNLPVTVVDAALQAAPEEFMSNGHIHLGHMGKRELSVSDLRKAWNELKASGDAEFATVEEEDQTVRIARAGNLMLVHVDKPGGKESVRVELPVEVVDALFSGPGEDLNLRAGFAELKKRRGDIVRVKDENSTVRIWIDEGN
jgi:hypothetical protein